MTATTKNRFRPTLEVLEARDLPSAHLAASLWWAPAAHPAHVRTIQASAELQAKTDVGSQQHKDNPTASLQDITPLHPAVSDISGIAISTGGIIKFK
jgi:hypothetical protein